MKRELMGCEEALRLLAEHLDGELAGADSREVGRHLERCRSCYSRAEFERGLTAAVGRLGSQSPAPALHQRIRALVASFPAASER